MEDQSGRGQQAVERQRGCRGRLVTWEGDEFRVDADGQGGEVGGRGARGWH